MARLQHVMSPPTAHTWLRWPEQFCYRDSHIAGGQGHLADDPRLEAIIQRLLTFGPAIVLLLFAPLRVFQLYKAKIVVLPNRRGYFKAVSSRPCTDDLSILES